MIGLVGWLAWGLCGALVRGSTYLTANESWVVKQELGPNSNCTPVDPSKLTGTTFESLRGTVKVLRRYHPDCVIYLLVEAQSNVTYPGIVVDGNGDHRPGMAVGPKTAAKIFGMSPKSSWRIGDGLSQFGKNIVIRAGLDKTVATLEEPANLSSWTTPINLGSSPENVEYSLIPESIRGPFQIASLDHHCLDSQCLSQSRTLKFITVLQEETDFISARNAWNVSFDVVPLCSGYPGYSRERVSCERLGTFAEVKGCLARIPDCAVEILATLKQAKTYDGLVYDSNSSTTPGARMGMKAVQRLLPRLTLEDWRLIEVSFEGREYSDELGSGACLRGSYLAFRVFNPSVEDVYALEDLLPSSINPEDFNAWWYKDKFKFVEAKIAYASLLTTGLFRNVVDDGSMGLDWVAETRNLGIPWDIDMAVQQKPGQTCDWRQTGCTVKLSYPAGDKKKSDYLKEKNNWSTRYLVVEGVNCYRDTWPSGCSDVAAGGAALQTCVEQIEKDDPTCTFDIRVELTQTIGFDGMVVGEEGNSAPIIAIGQNITRKAFTSPLKDHPLIYVRDVKWDVVIKGTGTQENACEAERSKDRMVSRNFLDAELPTPQKPANFSNDTWHNASFVSNSVQQHVVATLDPMADFSLSSRLVPGKGCVTRQQGATLTLAIRMRRNSEEFIHAADKWRIEYRIRGTRDCTFNSCTSTPFPRTTENGEVPDAGLRHCVNIISEGNPYCTGNITIRAHQDIVYPGLATPTGSTGAFALTPKASWGIQQDVWHYPMTQISLDFGGGFLNCKLDESKVLVFPEYYNSTLNLAAGKDAGFHITDSGMFTAVVDSHPEALLQSGTFVLKPRRSDCEWNSTTASILFENSEELPFAAFPRIK